LLLREEVDERLRRGVEEDLPERGLHGSPVVREPLLGREHVLGREDVPPLRAASSLAQRHAQIDRERHRIVRARAADDPHRLDGEGEGRPRRPRSSGLAGREDVARSGRDEAARRERPRGGEERRGGGALELRPGARADRGGHPDPLGRGDDRAHGNERREQGHPEAPAHVDVLAEEELDEPPVLAAAGGPHRRLGARRHHRDLRRRPFVSSAAHRRTRAEKDEGGRGRAAHVAIVPAAARTAKAPRPPPREGYARGEANAP
jgi:hypothetical protein